MATRRKATTVRPQSQWLYAVIFIMVLFFIGAVISIALALLDVAPTVTEQIVQDSNRTPAQFEMAMKMYEVSHEPASSSTIPTWLIVLFFIGATSALLWRGQHLIKWVTSFIRAWKKGKIEAGTANDDDPLQHSVPSLPLDGPTRPQRGKPERLEEIDWA